MGQGTKGSRGGLGGDEQQALNQAALDRVALRESEARYRALFNSIDEGFCIIEMIFEAVNGTNGDSGTSERAVDYRFIDANPAFLQQTGLHDAIGRTVRELVPAHEAHWFEIYGNVATTGLPVRFEAPAAALNRWYDVYALRVGEPGQRHVAVLFKDILARKQAEAHREQMANEVAAERERLRAVILQTPGPLALLEGPDHRFTLVKRGVQENQWRWPRCYRAHTTRSISRVDRKWHLRAL